MEQFVSIKIHVHIFASAQALRYGREGSCRTEGVGRGVQTQELGHGGPSAAVLLDLAFPSSLSESHKAHVSLQGLDMCTIKAQMDTFTAHSLSSVGTSDRRAGCHRGRPGSFQNTGRP